MWCVLCVREAFVTGLSVLVLHHFVRYTALFSLLYNVGTVVLIENSLILFTPPPPPPYPSFFIQFFMEKHLG